jgi:para-nitrobenzyl esterase
VEPAKLFETWQTAKKEIKGGAMSCSPVLDGNFVVGSGYDLLNESKHHQIPYMCGSTSEDVMPPMIYAMGRQWCEAQKIPSYAWFFDRQLPGDDNGAWHSCDLWYWFGTLGNCWRPFEPKDYELSEQMVSYLCNFVKTGNPNKGGELPTWIASAKTQKRVLCFGEKPTHMGKASMLKLVKTLLTNKAVGE